MPCRGGSDVPRQWGRFEDGVSPYPRKMSILEVVLEFFGRVTGRGGKHYLQTQRHFVDGKRRFVRNINLHLENMCLLAAECCVEFMNR
jgi:hypothetical protein